MSELEQFKNAMNDIKGVYGLTSFLIMPNGEVFNYSRLIETEILEEGSPSILQFFGDDMMLAFQKAALETLPDAQAQSSEDSSLQEEANVNANVTEGLDSGPDTSENLWESEGGGQTPHYDNVQDRND
ncbi:hypothetical protein LCGC14_2962950 [marine sediment metagenome]|uniref:Uncharacterized protein n=1 Tax=marine sediment metagenome TaxID=412755 RepID=A0A0F8XCI3_9ZZZZ